VYSIEYKKQKLSSALLRNALLNIMPTKHAVAFRAVVVHVIDRDAQEFYLCQGFFDTKSMEGLLILSTKDILKSAAAASDAKAVS